MSYNHPAWVAHQRKRWTRPDAYRFARPGSPEAKPPGYLHPWAEVARQEQAAADEAKACAAAEHDAFAREVLALRDANARVAIMLADLKFELALRRIFHKYSPDQRRVPPGNPDGGQWTDGGGGNGVSRDAPVTEFSAQARRAGPPRAPLTAQQQARLDVANAQAREAVTRVQQIDPNWRPTESLTDPNNNEAYIRAKEDIVREADKRSWHCRKPARPNHFRCNVGRPSGKPSGRMDSSSVAARCRTARTSGPSVRRSSRRSASP